MMMWVFALMIVSGAALFVADGNGGGLLACLLTGADNAVTLSITLAGSYILWMGLLNIAKRAGLVDALARVLKKPLSLLMPDADEAIAPAALNLAANFFGLGNAATPFGIETMQRLNKSGGKAATDSMCMFIALNASAIELLPTTVIAVRAACGASDPQDIILPTFISSVIAAIVAVVSCKLLSRLCK